MAHPKISHPWIALLLLVQWACISAPAGDAQDSGNPAVDSGPDADSDDVGGGDLPGTADGGPDVGPSADVGDAGERPDIVVSPDAGGDVGGDADSGDACGGDCGVERAACLDEWTVRTSVNGRCEGDTCQYDTEDIDCRTMGPAVGCRDGACRQLCCADVPGEPRFTRVSPVATYLQTDPTDTQATPSPAYALSDLAVCPGDAITVSTVGDFGWGFDFDDGVDWLVAVFSSSETLLGPENANRVPDALGAGVVDDATAAVPEDFRVPSSGVDVSIPAGATHFFVSTEDYFFGDNIDPDQDLGLSFTCR